MEKNEDGQIVWKGIEPTHEQLEQIIKEHNDWLDSEKQTLPPHNLSGIKLPKANLNSVNLSDSDLSEANLESAELNKAHLNGAKLDGANLDYAYLRGAKLIDAHLEGAHLKWAHLERAHLSYAHLSNAHLNNAHLNEGHLLNTHLLNAHLNSACLNEALLIKADLSGADLTQVDFTDANVAAVKYKDLKSCRGIRADTCYGSPLFRRHIMDEDFIEEMKARKNKVVMGIWWATSDYGRSLKRWILLTAGLVVLFAFFFLLLGDNSINLAGQKADIHVTNALYFSVVSFTSLGFGGLEPLTTTARWLVIVECLLGYVMLAGLIAIFLDKFARRAG